MHEGIYESLITRALSGELKRSTLVAALGDVDPADQPHVFARHVAQLVQHRLEGIKDQQERLNLVNEVVGMLDWAENIEPPARHLRSLTTASSLATTSQGLVRPTTPLAEAALLTNAHDEPNLAGELRAELASADGVDLICAFVRWHGLRLLEEALSDLQGRGVQMRVITTTYLGSTERRALDRLAREYGAEVRVQYDAQRTRLHAKAWLFRRRTGFDTAYVGSSNLSRAALLDGVEWNVRLASASTPSLLQKFEATFDAYWADAAFEAYAPDRDRDRLDDALAEAAGITGSERITISLAGLEVRPFPHQQTIIDALEAERLVHDRHRNLVVAATGTGKTVIAALDYRRLCLDGKRPSLLFVAHRKEILEQSLRTYREVLTDATFGELYVGGKRPERWEHVFASVQSLSTYGVSDVPADAFDVVVIDEFHHAAAPTYRALLDHLHPQELLGLTATPERADGTDVRSLFDGRVAAELRLWDAIGADLLVPFHYFAIADGTDLSAITWRRGRGYDEVELTNVYTGNDARAAIVLKEMRDKISDLGRARALGFCVSVDHATYMAKVLNAAGVPAAALSGSSSPAEREQVLADLRRGALMTVFAVDLFNEGLDIPEIDTILMLRPTESVTIFLQQLGRGLRRTPTKPVLTVLDFVGMNRKEFQFAPRYQALTGRPRGQLQGAIEDGFPFLPSGCQIVMDRQAQQIILDNVRSQLARKWPQIVAEARQTGSSTLADFLGASGLELSDVLRSGKRSWTELRRSAGLATPPSGGGEENLLKRVRAFAHVDDPERRSGYRRLLTDDVAEEPHSPTQERLAAMLYFSFWPGGGHASYAEGLAALRREPAVRDEVAQVVDLSFDQARTVTTQIDLPDVPLRIHARYQREEVLAALGYASLTRRPNSFREGVLHVPEIGVDAFFITLKKSEAAYSPTTMYRDYPIDPRRFHWESQSTTTVASPTGQRYLTGASTVLLFVRHESKGPFGTSPYLFLGQGRYESHVGEKPIAIIWRLDTTMPAEFFNAATVAAQ